MVRFYNRKIFEPENFAYYFFRSELHHNDPLVFAPAFLASFPDSNGIIVCYQTIHHIENRFFLFALRSVTSAIVLKGWEKAGLLSAFDLRTQMTALESTVTRPLFDDTFEYVVPDDDDPPELTNEDEEETKDPTQDEY